MKTRYKAILTIGLIATAFIAQAEDKHETHHPTTSAPMATMKISNRDTDQMAYGKSMAAQLAKMQGLQTSMTTAKTSAARQAIMHEAMSTMKDSMAMMKKTHMQHCQDKMSNMTMMQDHSKTKTGMMQGGMEMMSMMNIMMQMMGTNQAK